MYIVDRFTNSVVFIPTSSAVVTAKDARRAIKQNTDKLDQVDKQQ